MPLADQGCQLLGEVFLKSRGFQVWFGAWLALPALLERIKFGIANTLPTADIGVDSPIS
jgi:hypothetical protein